MPNFPLSAPFPSSADHIFSISVAKTVIYIRYIIVIFFILFLGWL